MNSPPSINLLEHPYSIARALDLVHVQALGTRHSDLLLFEIMKFQLMRRAASLVSHAMRNAPQERLRMRIYANYQVRGHQFGGLLARKKLVSVVLVPSFVC